MNKKYFENRVSCRKFSPVNISDDKILEIIKKAMRAPTCGNMQLYSVIITRDKDNLKKLSGYHYRQPASESAPVILTVCADYYRFSRWCKLNNADAGFNNFHSFITALTDAVILTQQIVTIAETEGFGTCYLGTVNYNAKEISELLDLPDLVIPVVSIAIGIPDEKPERVERLGVNSFTHFERYDDADDKKIADFFKIKDEFEANRRFVEENNKQNLAQVMSEVRYPRSMNEQVSETFYHLLKDKGFIK